MNGRKNRYDRLKLVGALENLEVGKTYKLSAWVYAEEATDNTVIFGVYKDSGEFVESAGYGGCVLESGCWTKIEFEYTHTDTEIKHVGFQEKGADSATATLYIDDVRVVQEGSTESTEESTESSEEDSESGEESTESTEDENKVIYEQTFDTLTSVDDSMFATGGNLKLYNVTLTTEIKDHTTGTGQSLKMTGRKNKYDRLKLVGALENLEVGETYKLSAWFYAANGTTNEVHFGVYKDAGEFVESGASVLEAGCWTKIEFEYTHTNEEIKHLGFQEKEGGTATATFYVDDVTVIKK